MSVSDVRFQKSESKICGYMLFLCAQSYNNLIEFADLHESQYEGHATKCHGRDHF
jgi:hypothetical protein